MVEAVVFAMRTARPAPIWILGQLSRPRISGSAAILKEVPGGDRPP